MSRMPGPQQASTGAPGTAVSMAVMVPRTSAHSSARVPAGVIGAVAPEMGIEYTQIGAPREANSTATSSSSPLTSSGERAAQSSDMRGRARKRSRSPDAISKMRRTWLSLLGQSTKTTGLAVSVRYV